MRWPRFTTARDRSMKYMNNMQWMVRIGGCTPVSFPIHSLCARLDNQGVIQALSLEMLRISNPIVGYLRMRYRGERDISIKLCRTQVRSGSAHERGSVSSSAREQQEPALLVVISC